MSTKTFAWLPTTSSLTEARAEFRRDYIDNGQFLGRPFGTGYWLFGVDHEKSRGWLVYEFGEDESQDYTTGHDEAVRAWRAGDKLPKNYFRLDPATIDRVFDVACEKWGKGWWFHGHDVTNVEEALQWTLLGEIRYG